MGDILLAGYSAVGLVLYLILGSVTGTFAYSTTGDRRHWTRILHKFHTPCEECGAIKEIAHGEFDSITQTIEYQYITTYSDDNDIVIIAGWVLGMVFWPFVVGFWMLAGLCLGVGYGGRKIGNRMKQLFRTPKKCIASAYLHLAEIVGGSK